MFGCAAVSSVPTMLAAVSVPVCTLPMVAFDCTATLVALKLVVTKVPLAVILAAVRLPVKLPMLASSVFAMLALVVKNVFAVRFEAARVTLPPDSTRHPEISRLPPTVMFSVAAILPVAVIELARTAFARTVFPSVTMLPVTARLASVPTLVIPGCGPANKVPRTSLVITRSAVTLPSTSR